MIVNNDNSIKPVDVQEMFVQEVGADGQVIKKTTLDTIDSPIKKLKEIILSLDWEINDTNLARFDDELEYLNEIWKKEKIYLAFLRILRALGRYIHSHKAATHSDAIRVLYSVYNGLEKILISPEMGQARKVQIVQGELQKYNDLKQRIDLSRTAPPAKEDVSQKEPIRQEKSFPAEEFPEEEKKETDDAIRPALSSVVSPETAQPAWEQEVPEGSDEIQSRLNDFFGEDTDVAAAEQESQENGVVPLVMTEDPTFTLDKTSPPATDISPTEETADTRNWDLTSLDRETPAPSTSEPSPIIEDLFQETPATPADELISEMHLGMFQKTEETTAPLDSSAESIPLQDAEAGKVIQAEDVSQQLDAFFGDDSENTLDFSGDVEGGVVPLPVAETAEEGLATPAAAQAKDLPSAGLVEKIKNLSTGVSTEGLGSIVEEIQSMSNTESDNPAIAAMLLLMDATCKRFVPGDAALNAGPISLLQSLTRDLHKMYEQPDHCNKETVQLIHNGIAGYLQKKG